MRKLLIAGAALTLLAGCSSGRGIFGRGGPDEFQVARAAPLVVPPDFALVPPQAGAAPTQNQNLQGQALEAMFGPASRPAAEQAALTAAGAARAEDGIRSTVGDPATTVVDKGATTAQIIAAPEGDGQGARTAAGTTPQQPKQPQ